MRRLALLLTLTLTSAGLAACSMPMHASPAGGQKFVVFFQEWSANIDDSASGAIQSAADYAVKNAGQPVLVSGFADMTGSAQANIDLSQTRSQVVYDLLVKDGVPASRIQRASHGSTDFSLSSLESRRVDITVGSP